MINGHMAEAQQGFAVLKEVDEGTFLRFAQWTYRGYYTSAEHDGNSDDQKGSKPVDDVENAVQIVDGTLLEAEPDYYRRRSSCSPYPSSVIQQSPRQKLKESFINRKYSVRQNSISVPPRANKSPTEDYTGVFLCHAQVYVFAEQYDIQNLKALALEELQLALAIYTLYPERTGDIVALLRYIYANTGEPAAGVEDLRTLLTAYMSYEIDTLVKDKAFKEVMLEDGGALLGDFMEVVEKRI